MIGGHDIEFHTETSAQTAEGALPIIFVFWPEAVVENAETGEELRRDNGAFNDFPHELLVYKNTDARNAWAHKGAVPENANSMIHLIRGESSLTVVVDEPSTKEMKALLQAIREHVCESKRGSV